MTDDQRELDRVQRGMRPELAHLHVDTYADRAAWLAARSDPTSIGASNAPVVLGVAPQSWGTQWAFWSSKRDPQPEKRSDVLQRGHRWESAVVAEYEDDSGYECYTPGLAVGAVGALVTLSNPTIGPWLRESPDAFALDNHGVLGQVEAKTAIRPREWSPEQGLVVHQWEDRYADVVPPHYAIQGYTQLAVSELPWVDLCALVPGRMWLAIRWVRLMRDADTQSALVESLAAWREQYLVRGDEPPIDGSNACTRYLVRKYPALAGKQKPSRIALEQELKWMHELAIAGAQAKEAGKRKRVLGNLLIRSADGHKLLTNGFRDAPYGQPQPTSSRTSFDLTRLRAEHPQIAAQYTREHPQSTAFRLYRFPEYRDPKAPTEDQTHDDSTDDDATE